VGTREADGLEHISAIVQTTQPGAPQLLI